MRDGGGGFVRGLFDGNIVENAKEVNLQISKSKLGKGYRKGIGKDRAGVMREECQQRCGFPRL